ATRDDRPRAGRREVGDHLLLLVEHLRADRHVHFDRLSAGAVLPGAAAVRTATGPQEVAPLDGRQVAEVRVRDEDDVAAGPAVAAVRPALRHVLLAAEADRAVSPASGLHLDARPVVEHAVRRAQSVTEMNRRSPLVRNETVPSRFAKIVSSRPRPAPGPGR